MKPAPYPIPAVRAPHGAVTALLHEALDCYLARELRDHLLDVAGWDPDRDAPLNPQLTMDRFVDRVLFRELVDRLGLIEADEIRTHLRALLRSTHEPPAQRSTSAERSRLPTEPELEVPSALARLPEPFVPGTTPERSGLRPRSTSATVPTMIPAERSQRLLVWSEDLGCAEALRTRFGTTMEVCSAVTAEELAARLDDAEEKQLLVIVDRRTAALDEELDELPAWTFVGSRVLVWGAPETESPSLARVLEHCERAVGCSDEAGLGDLAALSAHLMGRPV